MKTFALARALRSVTRIVPTLVATVILMLAPASAGRAADLNDKGHPPARDDERLARAVLEEMNRVRTDPAGYVQVLRDYRAQFDGLVVRRPGRIAIRTYEGVAAVDEAIRFLQDQAPAPPIRHDPTLDKAARDLVLDQGPAGGFGHYGSNGATFVDRFVRYGDGPYGAENISYGYDTAREVVIQLLVDDNVPNRGHRVTMFNPRYVRMGANCGPHALYTSMCVIDYGY